MKRKDNIIKKRVLNVGHFKTSSSATGLDADMLKTCFGHIVDFV